MPSLFAAAAADSAAAVDSWYAEEFLLEPQIKPDVNGRSLPDPARAVAPFRGIFIAKGSVLHAQGRNRADSTTMPVTADSPTIRLTVETLPIEPQRDDFVTRVDTGERFRVASGLERQFGGLRLKLTELR